MIKITQYLYLQEMCINTVKQTCGRTTANAIFDSEIFENFSLRSGIEAGCQLTFLFYVVSEVMV